MIQTQFYCIHENRRFCKEFVDNIETRLDSSKCELVRSLPKGKNKKVNGLTSDELGAKTITKFVGLKTKTSNYLMDDGSKDKKAKDTKKCVKKRKLKFENYKNYLKQLNSRII